MDVSNVKKKIDETVVSALDNRSFMLRCARQGMKIYGNSYQL
jgi:hypothetical protein